MLIKAFPSWWASKFQGLRTIALPAQLPLMDGDIADLHQKADQLIAVAEGVFADLDSWQWSHELFAVMHRLRALSMICETEITITFDPTEIPDAPKFREDFQQMWNEAGAQIWDHDRKGRITGWVVSFDDTWMRVRLKDDHHLRYFAEANRGHVEPAGSVVTLRRSLMTEVAA